MVTFLIAAPLVALAVRPTQGVHLAQLLAVAVAVTAAAVWTGYLPQLVPAVLVAVNALVIAALTGGTVRGSAAGPWLRWLVVAGAVGGGAFAAMAVDNHPMTVPDITWGASPPADAGRDRPRCHHGRDGRHRRRRWARPGLAGAGVDGWP